MNTETDILSIIPQRAPFVMIDRFMHGGDKISRTALQIREENIFVENGAFIEAGMVENMAQTAAAGIGYICRAENRPVPLGYIGAVQRLEIKGLPKLNQVIETEVSVKHEIFNATVISGKITCGGEILALCEMKIFISNQQ